MIDEDFSLKLIKWYNVNKRDLPWRKTNDPYKIWISEIVLQQTRVDQGLPYYLNFIKEFPKVKNLLIYLSVKWVIMKKIYAMKFLSMSLIHSYHIFPSFEYINLTNVMFTKFEYLNLTI